MTDIRFPECVLGILEKLNNAGFEAYIVGGAVRDALLGNNSSDFDVATNAKTDDVKRVFADANIIETGVKHGTVTVVSGGVGYEITTFRSDGEYSDARHPDSVKFLNDISGDLARRDFTINAMAYSVKTGVIDLFDGKKDLADGIIRAVGDPEKRFEEDGLRILRAVRFAAKLGFKIEENTLSAMKKCVKNLQSLSVERVFSEVTQTLCAKHAYFALHEYAFFLFAVVPEIQPEYNCDQMNRSHAYDVYEHTLQAIKNCEKVTPAIMWSLLFHDAGKPFAIVYGPDDQRHFPNHWVISEQIADKVLARFKASNELKREVGFITLYHDDHLYGGKPVIKRFLNTYGKDYMYDLAVVKKADWLAHSEFGIKRYEKAYYTFLNYLNEVIDNDECYKISQLKINGEDVKALGFGGVEVGEILDKVLGAVIEGTLENDKQKILEFIKRNG